MVPPQAAGGELVGCADAGGLRRLRRRDVAMAQARREWTRAEANFHLARGEWNRAEANFRLARQAVDDYFNRVSQNKLLDVPGMQPLRKELLETALEYYQGFVKERADDPALQAELADAYFKMGFINDEIGSKAEALSAYQMALATYQKLAGEHPDDPELRRTAGQDLP